MPRLSTLPGRILVVDDSGLVRRTVRRLIEETGELTVVGEAANGVEAIEHAATLDPDAITLDVDMPVMSGLQALPRLIQTHHQRVIMLSTLTTAHAYPTFKALALGALDFIPKPGTGSYLSGTADLGREIREKLRSALTVPRSRLARLTRARLDTIPQPTPATTQDADLSPTESPDQIIAIGSSTGGTAPLEAILAGLPPASRACVVVVQHLPPGFSRPFAQYLGSITSFRVTEPIDHEQLRARHVYVAPASGHLRIQRLPTGYSARIDYTTSPVNGYRPSIDVLFYSLALAARAQTVGVVLSGMGRDGARGLAAIRHLGGVTLCQAIESCVVPEMPRAAMGLGVVDSFFNCVGLPSAISRMCAAGGRERGMVR